MAALGSITTATTDACYKLLISTLILLLVGSVPHNSKYLKFSIKTAAAQGNLSNSAGYTAFVRFRLNTTSPLRRVSATLSVWNPNVTRAEDYSLGKISIVRVDPQTQNVTASMESGYIVFPARYGDTTTRFYIRWNSKTNSTVQLSNAVLKQTNILACRDIPPATNSRSDAAYRP